MGKYEQLVSWIDKNRKIDTFGKSIGVKIGIGLGIIAGIAIFSLIGGFFIKILWNWLMPELFGLAKLTYWKAWGISMLSAMLFGSKSSGS